MKLAHLMCIFWGVFSFNLCFGNEIEENGSQKCCRFSENIGRDSCLYFCEDTKNLTSNSAEQEVIEEEIKPIVAASISSFSSLASVCRKGFRRDSTGICRKVLVPRTSTVSTVISEK